MRTFESFVNKYHKKWIREDEDVDAVAYSIVNSFTREQCIDLLNELSDEELHFVVAQLVMEQVKEFLIRGEYGDDSLLH
ncbi:hypothetical protein M3936_18450 [Sutcliffiella horikoshii]|uniref:hypothetical protein n=1 Tax=Sutcliffiella horikoshii TaxID=79883 RepID=UPI0007D06D77|nr:hypothetical protein [Sutcliffiella horikoshii]MCM3619577.1 hypothetical protein [Sutcliffiella horikoshii]